jgi:Protein of unknown function (DUF742)
MNDGHSAPPPADEPLGRPFLAAAIGPELPSAPAATGTRPYLLTGGRTEVDDPTVAMETIVVAARHAVGPVPARDTWRTSRSYEKEAILALCGRPLSVAEVAAHLRIPLGVARVLVADLIAGGSLVSSAAAGNEPAQLTQDVALIERLIAGVAAL